MSTAEVLRRITAALDQAEIPYMITGSVASALYGVPRATQDIDLVIAATAPQLRRLVQLLPPPEFYADLSVALDGLQSRSMFNVLHLATGWKIDFIFRKDREFSKGEFSRRTQGDLQGVKLYVATAEDVIISKLEWAKLGESKRQIEDVAAVLRLRWESLDRDYLERWIRALLLEEQWKEATDAAGYPR